MNGEVHMAVGTATATGMALVIPQMQASDTKMLGLGIGCAIIGALMPDIDANGESKIKKQFRKTLTLLLCGLVLTFGYGYATGSLASIVNQLVHTQAVIGLIGFLVLSVIGYMSGHRQFTHWLLACVLFTFSWYIMFGKTLAIWFCLGYLSHILIDLLNKKPIKLFFPLPLDIMFGICYADSAMAKVIGGICTGLTVVFIGMITGVIRLGGF